MELTEGIIKDYFNSPLEQKANYYGEADVNKLIYFSKILAHCGNLILINNYDYLLNMPLNDCK